ncbi:MAG: Nif3-like dinuclear metal center hexameric protein [Fimbriimonadaceae bacterium]
MPTVSDVLDAIEQIAPARYAFTFDHIGLQVGDPAAKVARIVVSLDPSLAAARFARSRGAQMLVCHHPVIWDPMPSLTYDGYKASVVRELVEAGIAFAAAHTNWDCAPGGINDVLAELIGLRDVRAIGSVSDKEQGGHAISRIGSLPKAMSADEFRDWLDARLSARTLLCAPNGATIQSVVVCGGAAGDEWVHAQGADAFVSGEVPHHLMVEASERGVAIAACGHYATENPGTMRLGDLISKTTGIEVTKFEPPPGTAGRPR